MTDLTESEAIEYVLSLQHETSTLRQEAEDARQVYGLYRLPKLPKDLQRKEAVYILSPEVIHEEKEIRSLIMTFQTQVTNLPLERNDQDVITQQIQKQADQLEKAAAIFLRRLDPDRTLEEDGLWYQLVQPLSIDILELGPIQSANPAERFPWRQVNVDLDGCGWLENLGIPTVFGRHYQQFVFEVQQQSIRADGPEGPRAMLQRDSNGRWDWTKWEASEDFTPRHMPAMTSTQHLQKADMVWLDDFNGSGMIYLIAMDAPQDGGMWGRLTSALGIGQKKPQGKLVWKGQNPFNRCSAFLTPGNRTPQRKPEDKYHPYLDELIVTTEQENIVESTSMTGARNRASPRNYIAADPDALKEYMQRNNGALPPPTTWPDDGGMLTIMGEVKTPAVPVDPDEENLRQQLEARRLRYVHGALALMRDPQVLKESTATGLISAWDSGMTSLSPILGARDRTKRQMIEAWEASIKWIAANYGASYAKFELVATGGEYAKGKKLTAGDSSVITADSFDNTHQWLVNTRSKTLAQTQAMLQLAIERMAPLPDGRPNIGTYEELMDAADVTDVDERINRLAIEHISYELDDQWLIEMAKLSVEHEIEVAEGERIQLSSQDPAALAQQLAGPPGGLAPAPPPGGEGPGGPTPPPAAPAAAARLPRAAAPVRGRVPPGGARERAPLTEPGGVPAEPIQGG